MRGIINYMKRVPLVPFPLEKVIRFSRIFIGFGETVSNFFPSLGWDLDQSDMDMEPREWCGIALFSALFYFVLLFGLMISITRMARVSVVQGFGISFLVGASIGGAAFLYISMYPKLMAKKKIRSVDENLPHALHHLLIQIRSGVPLFNCLVSVSHGDYGQLSKVFERTVDEINTGKSEIEAMETLARENPSLYFRRVLWQMVNALKSGAAVDRHLADNLIPLMALCGGEIKTEKITGHIRSNIFICEKFLEVDFRIDEKENMIIVE